jgi:hypothetical protein
MIAIGPRIVSLTLPARSGIGSILAGLIDRDCLLQPWALANAMMRALALRSSGTVRPGPNTFSRERRMEMDMGAALSSVHAEARRAGHGHAFAGAKKALDPTRESDGRSDCQVSPSITLGLSSRPARLWRASAFQVLWVRLGSSSVPSEACKAPEACTHHPRRPKGIFRGITARNRPNCRQKLGNNFVAATGLGGINFVSGKSGPVAFLFTGGCPDAT